MDADGGTSLDFTMYVKVVRKCNAPWPVGIRVDRKKAMMKPGEKLGFFREVMIYEHVKVAESLFTSSFGKL